MGVHCKRRVVQTLQRCLFGRKFEFSRHERSQIQRTIASKTSLHGSLWRLGAILLSLRALGGPWPLIEGHSGGLRGLQNHRSSSWGATWSSQEGPKNTQRASKTLPKERKMMPTEPQNVVKAIIGSKTVYFQNSLNVFTNEGRKASLGAQHRDRETQS